MVHDLHCKALSARVDGADCVLTFEGDDTPNVGRAALLLDARGGLVGVDLGAEGFERVAVMLGAHEDVASTRPASVSVGPGVLRIHGGARFVASGRPA